MNNKIFKKMSWAVLGASLLLSFGSTNVHADEKSGKAESVIVNKKEIEQNLDLQTIKDLIDPFRLTPTMEVLKVENKINTVEKNKADKVLDDLVSNLENKESNDILKDKIVESKNLGNESKIDTQVPISMKDSLIKNLSDRNELIKEEEQARIAAEKAEQERIAKEKAERERLAKEAEAKRIAAEKAEKERIAKEKEAKRLASRTTYKATESLNIRGGAGVNKEIVGYIPKGQTFEAYDYNGEWVEIVSNNGKRYVTAKYIKEVTTVSTNSNKSTQNSVGVTSKTTGNKVYNLTSDERVLLEKLVEAEAGDQSYEGRVAVATVIANRVEMSGSFASNITDVIYAKNQFSPTFDGRLEKMKPGQTTKNAVSAVFDKGERNLPKNIVFFCTNEIREYSWINTRAFYTEIGDHSFFYNYAK